MSVIEKAAADSLRFVDAEELARALRISRRTLADWIQHGLIPKPMKIGSRRLWDPEKLRHHLEQSCHGED